MTVRFFLLCMAFGSFGCGQTTSGNDAGADGESLDVMTLDVITSGCSNGHSDDVAYDASACVSQLKSTFSCNGSICSWNVIIPCASADAGDAGDGGDAGFDCQKACNDAKPTGKPDVNFCEPGGASDAGTVFSCGGCGV